MITRILIAASLLLCCGCSPNLEKARELAQKYPNRLDTSGILFLTPELAADLVLAENHFRQTGCLYLEGLRTLDKEVAHELLQLKGYGELDGMTDEEKESLPPEVNGGSLVFGDLSFINKDVANELAKRRGGIEFGRGLTSIDKDIAHELAKFKGFFLDLGLTSIDKDVAKELATYQGQILQFPKLESIDKDVARELVKFKGDLRLWGLKFDKAIAQEFANFKGEKLYLASDIFWAEDVPRRYQKNT